MLWSGNHIGHHTTIDDHCFITSHVVISGNVNVMAYSLLFKLPFLYYFSERFKKLSWLFIVIATLIIFTISSILETRSAVLTAIFISICFFMYYLFDNKKITIKNSLKAFRVVILPLISAFLLSNLASNTFDKGTVTDRMSTLANLENDTSLGQRFRYFAAAFETIKEKPLTGVGIGNWELASVPFEKNYMKSYIVPYHAHNDYLETAAETGVVGLLLYYGFISSILDLEFVSTLILSNSNVYSPVKELVTAELCKDKPPDCGACACVVKSINVILTPLFEN